MSLGGSYQDHHLIMIKETLDQELQQNGSLLLGTVKREMVGGVKVAFNKVGKLDSYEKTGRNQLKQPQNATFERRLITFQATESDILVDKTDVLDMASNPSSDYIELMRNEIGRAIDDLIISTLKGTQARELSGATSNVALPSASKIAVNSSAYGNGGSDNALTSAKLKEALANLGTAHVDVSRNKVYCVAPFAQLMNLATEAEVVSRDYRSSEALETKGAIPGLNGYLGITFIAHEQTGVDASSDQLVYVYSEDAVKVGIRQEITVSAHEDYTRSFNPTMLSAFIDLGAARMHEEKVQEIACDPL